MNFTKEQRLKYLLNQQLYQDNPELMSLKLAELEIKLNNNKGEKGDPGQSIKGEKGNDGYTPIKGKDYFTGEEIKSFKEEIRPIKGQDYFDGKDGEDGKDADETKIIDKVLSLVPVAENGKDGSPDSPIDIKNKLETLQDDERLDAKAIKGLPNFDKRFESIQDQVNKKIDHKKFNMSDLRWHGGGTIVRAEDLSSQCNGVNKTFTLTKYSKVILLSGTQFPLIYRPVIDFTTPTSTTIELTSEVGAPESDQTLIAVVI